MKFGGNGRAVRVIKYTLESMRDKTQCHASGGGDIGRRLWPWHAHKVDERKHNAS